MHKSICGKFMLVVLGCCAARFTVAQKAPAPSPETEQRIQRVTTGLTGEVVIKGDEHATHMLADRMKELGIPGVSIAVIHE